MISLRRRLWSLLFHVFNPYATFFMAFKITEVEVIRAKASEVARRATSLDTVCCLSPNKIQRRQDEGEDSILTVTVTATSTVLQREMRTQTIIMTLDLPETDSVLSRTATRPVTTSTRAIGTQSRVNPHASTASASVPRTVTATVTSAIPRRTSQTNTIPSQLPATSSEIPITSAPIPLSSGTTALTVPTLSSEPLLQSKPVCSLFIDPFFLISPSLTRPWRFLASAPSLNTARPPGPSFVPGESGSDSNQNKFAVRIISIFVSFQSSHSNPLATRHTFLMMTCGISHDVFLFFFFFFNS